MSRLIQMRRRIKAITTIKKITSAMRLIARSFHSSLRQRQVTLSDYQKELRAITQKLHLLHATWRPAWLFPPAGAPEHHLYIIVGSQKGLCGNFNSGPLYWMNTHRDKITNSGTQVITFGKRITDHATLLGCTVLKQYQELKINDLTTVSEELLSSIQNAIPSYRSVVIVSNHSKNFFTPETKVHSLIPFALQQETEQSVDLNDYTWAHESDLLAQRVTQLYLSTALYSMLIDSFLSEQATRFIAMDNATRNADNFLATLRLQYNKLRQEKITKELIELLGSFDSPSNPTA